MRKTLHLGRLRGATEGGEDKMEEGLAHPRVGVAEEPRLGHAIARSQNGRVETQQEAIGVHGALQFDLPLPLPIHRHQCLPHPNSLEILQFPPTLPPPFFFGSVGDEGQRGQSFEISFFNCRLKFVPRLGGAPLRRRKNYTDM